MPIHFLDFPGEVRNRIYEEVPSEPTTLTLGPSAAKHIPEYRVDIFNLTLTCRQIRQEFRASIYRHLTIIVFPQRHKDIAGYISEEVEQRVVHLRLYQLGSPRTIHLDQIRVFPNLRTCEYYIDVTDILPRPPLRAMITQILSSLQESPCEMISRLPKLIVHFCYSCKYDYYFANHIEDPDTVV